MLATAKARTQDFLAWTAEQDAQAQAALQRFIEESISAQEDSPQQNPDAMLDLYHSLSGQSLCSSVLYPPPDDAPPEQWANWRERCEAEITKHTYLQPPTAASIVDAFMAVRSPTRPLCACASCGRRKPDSSKYVSIGVSKLPGIFKLTPEQRNAREALGTVDLLHVDSASASASQHPSANADGSCLGNVTSRQCDLRQLVSCYEYNGALYHLYPNLVQSASPPVEDCDGDQELEPHVALCQECGECAASLGNMELKPPPCSLAEGVDFGALHALELPEPTALERLILADCRPYATVIKVATDSNLARPNEQRRRLTGHWIAFTHNGPQELAQLLMRSTMDRVRDVSHKVKVHLIGPNGAHDVLWKRLQALPDMMIRPTVVLNHLRVRLAVSSVPYYKDPILTAHAPEQLPSIEELAGQFDWLLQQLRDGAVRDHNLSVERAQKKASGDISGTRAPSADDDDDAAAEARRALKEVSMDEADHTEGHEHEGGDGVQDGINDDGGQGSSQGGGFVMNHTAIVRPEPSSETVLLAALEQAQEALKRKKDREAVPEQEEEALNEQEEETLNVGRSDQPINEFERNGRQVMQTFWFHFPLQRGLQRSLPLHPHPSHHIQIHSNDVFRGSHKLTNA